MNAMEREKMTLVDFVRSEAAEEKFFNDYLAVLSSR